MTILMIVIKRNRVTFYISNDRVVVSNGSLQHSAYSSYSTLSKTNFYKFRDEILKSKPNQFNNIIDVVELSSKHEVYGHSTSKPNLDGIEYVSKS